MTPTESLERILKDLKDESVPSEDLRALRAAVGGLAVACGVMREPDLRAVFIQLAQEGEYGPMMEAGLKEVRDLLIEALKD